MEAICVRQKEVNDLTVNAHLYEPAGGGEDEMMHHYYEIPWTVSHTAAMKVFRLFLNLERQWRKMEWSFSSQPPRSPPCSTRYDRSASAAFPAVAVLRSCVKSIENLFFFRFLSRGFGSFTMLTMVSRITTFMSSKKMTTGILVMELTGLVIDRSIPDDG